MKTRKRGPKGKPQNINNDVLKLGSRHFFLSSAMNED